MQDSLQSMCGLGVSLRHGAGRNGWLSSGLAGMVDSLRRAELARRVQDMPHVARENCESHMPKKAPASVKSDGRCRAVISSISPEIESGRFAIKRTVGETVEVEADIFADGHDQLSAVLLYRPDGESSWAEGGMAPLGNDRWRGQFRVARLGVFRYTVLAWVDAFKTWHHDLVKKHRAGQDVAVELLAGARMVEAGALRAAGEESRQLSAWARLLAKSDPARKMDRLELALSSRLAELMALHPDRPRATRYDRELLVVVDPVLARFGAWYELFPRSLGKDGSSRYAFGMSRRICRGWRPWVSMCCTCHRSIRWADRFARGRTTRRRRGPASRAVPGPLARRREGTRRFIRSWGRSRIFAGWWWRRADGRSRSPWTSRFSVRRIIPM